MKKIDLLKKKIDKAKEKRQALLVELKTLKTLVSKQGQNKDMKKIEELKKQLLNNI